MAQSAAQKAAQNRLIAAAKAAQRKGLKGKAFRTFVGNATRGKGGGGKGKKAAKKPGKALTAKGGRGGGSTAVTNPRRAPQIGAALTAFKSSAITLSPGLEEGLKRIQARDRDFMGAVQAVREKVMTLDYAGNLAIVVADAAIDRKMAHATALTMGSVTAWLPEGFLSLLAIDEVRTHPERTTVDHIRGIQKRLILAHQGYDPIAGKLVLSHGEFRVYRGLRHGGQALRWARGKNKQGRNRLPFIRKLTEPLAKLAAMFGGRV